MTPEQKELLSRNLDSGAVRTRSQGSSKVAYIDGYQAISTANEIFGFDGWSHRLISIEVCHCAKEQRESENERGDKVLYDFHEITYRAVVEVTALGRTCQDVGYGQGQGKKLCDAHEKAGKEAVTDGIKRCLKSFGNPFGLALYDKERRNVGDGSVEGKRITKAGRTKAKNADDADSQTERQLRMEQALWAILGDGYSAGDKKSVCDQAKALAKNEEKDWVDVLCEMAGEGRDA